MLWIFILEEDHGLLQLMIICICIIIKGFNIKKLNQTITFQHLLKLILIRQQFGALFFKKFGLKLKEII